ncbi:MAG: TRAP transporter large permease subunit, partial [Hydrogenophaga sp.]|nr:TRAP transporter large permease subunit [Hydrogenophaga sp.]
QTSFLTPPFGFALFYLRSVAARSDYTDEVTKERIPAVTTGQIYKGSIAFIVLQVIMLALVISYPTLVTGNIEAAKKVDAKTVDEMLLNMPGLYDEPAPAGAAPGGAASEVDPLRQLAPPPEDETEKEVDPAKALMDSLKSDKPSQ